MSHVDIKYVLCDSWLACVKLIQAARKFKNGAIHFIGADKEGRNFFIDVYNFTIGIPLSLLVFKSGKTKRCKELGF
jgi:hypothetical protein